MLISLSQIAKNLNIQEGDYVALEERDGGFLSGPFLGTTKTRNTFGPISGREK